MAAGTIDPDNQPFDSPRQVVRGVAGRRARHLFTTLARNVMAAAISVKQELHEGEGRLLAELRALRRNLRATTRGARPAHELTLGQRIADRVAATMGSWNFIIIQTLALSVWIVLNVTAFVQKWDPYPFILLNLALSFQAAYAAPFIMMAQNRQQDIDRKKAEDDFKVNVKAELEIELLHQKVDELREKEVLALVNAVSELTQQLRQEKPGA
jgi:uncharacterized membrane protein